MNDIAVLERMEGARRLGAVVTPLDVAALPTDIESLCSLSRHASRNPLSRLNASDQTKADVVAWLRSLEIPLESLVLIAWPHYRAAASLSFGDLINAYDELWYPSADDLVVTDAQRSWIITFDHEEVFTFGRSE